MRKGRQNSLAVRLKAWLSDRSGSVSIDFVVSIPILLAVLVLTSEYGRVLQARSTLDNAVSDATRYLARVEFADQTNQTFSSEIITVAEGLIRSRLNSPHIAIGTPVVGNVGGYDVITLSAAVGIETPALQLLGIGSSTIEIDGIPLEDVEGLILSSTDTARHFGL